MANVQGQVLSAAERSLRSAFVGNIPYEATEEQLKDIFSEVGPVVSFRLVYDRETGKPKGYGFCEYKDQETALSAMRNLNGYELNGRPLRVDNAASEKSKEELKNLQATMGGQPIDSPYGTSVEPERAPEAISKAVASLPPEQMFELMKQMKVCIQNNPNEARNMLLQNPQLAYALLQAQVIMRIVEPQVALGLLHRQTPNPTPIMQRDEQPEPTPTQAFPNANPPPPAPEIYEVGQMFKGSTPPVPAPNIRPAAPARTLIVERPPENRPQPTVPQIPVAPPPQAQPVHLPGFQDRAPSQYGREGFEPMVQEPMGDRDMRSQLVDRDMRQPPVPPMGPLMGDRDMRQIPMGDQDLRHIPATSQPPVDPRFRNMPTPGGPFGNVTPRPNFTDPRSGNFDRGAPVRPDERPPMPMPMGIGPSMAPMPPRPPVPQPPRPPAPARAPQPPPAGAASMAGISPQDQEKAALIMQVLQLSDQQIAMLPPEQRQSILILKEQVARSAH